MSFFELRRLFRLIDQAWLISLNEDMDAEERYDIIFGMNIWQKIRDAGYSFEWYDPDTSYEADIEAYVSALIEFKQKHRILR